MSVLAELDDDVLAHRAIRDLDAFAELYRRYVCRIYRFVRSQTRDEDTAEDLTAQVFFKALASANTFRGEGSYRAWIYRIAHNSISTWRRRSNQSALVVEELPEARDPSPSPASQAIAHEARSVVRRTVFELPPAQREVVDLRYLNDLSVEEIATFTRRSPGAVRLLLHRGLARLRTALEGKDVTWPTQ